MKVNFFLSQTAQFAKSTNLFYLVFLTLKLSFAVYFLELTQHISIATYNQANSFLTISIIAFDFIMLSDLNYNSNNLIEILFIRVFLVNCLMCLNTLKISSKISKSFLSVSILINIQPSCCSIAICLFIS